MRTPTPARSPRNPLNILEVIPRFAPAWQYGGGVRVSYDLDLALLRRGFRVSVYTSDQIDDHTRAPSLQEDIHGIVVRRFRNPANALASQASWLCFHPRGMKAALAANVGRFDVVHVAEARGPHVRWAFAAAKRAGVPVVWSPLGGLADGVGIRKPYPHLYDVLYDTRRLVAEAGALVAQSAHEVTVCGRFGADPQRVRIIGLGVDVGLFQTLPPRGHLRRSLGLEPADPLVLYVGRLHPTKGVDVLLEAAAIVKRSHPTLKVVLLTWDHGSLGTVLRLTQSLGLEDAIRMLPPAFERARVQAYVDADVFAVAATTYEETSLAAMEALAAGTPCVLTRQCAVPGLEEMGAGVVTDCTPEAFAEGLQSVLADPDRRAHATRARQAIVDAHTAEHMADAYVDLFRGVTRAPNAQIQRPAELAGTCG